MEREVGWKRWDEIGMETGRIPAFLPCTRTQTRPISYTRTFLKLESTKPGFLLKGSKRGEAISCRPPTRKCEVCLVEQSKYKCPNCLAPYCSLACLKKHKDTPCEKPLPLVEEQPKLMPPKRSLQVDQPGWVVDKEYLRLLANSSEIREALKNGDIRRTIQKIDGADEPEHGNTHIHETILLTEALEGQTFRYFTEKILSIVSLQY